MGDERQTKKQLSVSVNEMKEKHRIKWFNIVLGKYSEAVLIITTEVGFRRSDI